MLKVAGGGGTTTGALTYAGTWNALTNTPTLTSGVGITNNYYVVSVAGTTNLDGIVLWNIGDWAIFNGTVWEKISGSNQVVSVNGKTGVVVLGPTDVGATPNTAYVLTSGLLSGGGQLTGNVTVTLNNVPSGNVTGLGTMATQNANNVTITGGTENGVTYSNVTVTSGTENGLTYTNVTIQSGTFVGSNVKVSNGVYSTSTFNGTYADGIVVDYVTGNGRISVGTADGLTFYNSGVGNVTLGSVTAAGLWNLPNVSANVVVTNPTSSTATFATSSLPLVPAGYIQIQLANATVVKVPYYAA